MKPSQSRLVLFTVLLAIHGAVTLVALAQAGVGPFVEQAIGSWGARQVLSDLSAAVVLINVWLVADARKRGTNPWLYVVLSIPLGTVAPLIYLVRRELQSMAAAGRGPRAVRAA
jgi:hypothetical protein